MIWKKKISQPSNHYFFWGKLEYKMLVLTLNNYLLSQMSQFFIYCILCLLFFSLPTVYNFKAWFVCTDKVECRAKVILLGTKLAATRLSALFNDSGNIKTEAMYCCAAYAEASALQADSVMLYKVRLVSCLINMTSFDSWLCQHLCPSLYVSLSYIFLHNTL